MGNRRSSPPPPIPANGPAAPQRSPQSCRCQHSSWSSSGTERGGGSGSRAALARPAPPPPAAPCAARARPTQRAARPRAPWIPTRGVRGLTAAPALAPGPRALLPPPGRMAAASGQRRFLALALTVGWVD
nr:atherin-like [Symphalangus syndactylus]